MLDILIEVLKLVGLIGLGTIAVAYIVVEVLYRMRGDDSYKKPPGPRRYY